MIWEKADAPISDWRTSFTRHPLKVVQIEDFLDQQLATQLEAFLTKDAVYKPKFVLKGDGKDRVNADQWDAAPDSERFLNFDHFSITGQPAANIGLMSLMRLRARLMSPEFCSFAASITDQPIDDVTDVQIHRMRRGHMLRDHNDQLPKRRLAYVLYLSSDWQESYGGKLVLRSHDNVEYSFEPKFNSMVIFDVAVHEAHFVQDLTPAAQDWGRHTIGGWFLDSTG